MTQMQQDELARLFASQLNVSQERRFVIEPVAPPPVRRSALPIDFVSSHYTGTAHIRAETISEPSASPPPPYQEAYVSHEMAYTLRQHSIDPTSLLPNQVKLFQNADYEQKLRLLELWRISPPSYLQSSTSTQWDHETSMQREEVEAKSRYEQQFSDVEPYIADGYQSLQAYPSHMEPIYAAKQGLWNPSNSPSNHVFEHHSMHDQLRNHADWERMNEAIARERFANLHRSTDDEMML